jgi:serine phosphatase RsbU (regulator of sigma subunit)/anti-sigma regulatory factor (Ser/Thr protein kinase)
MTSANEEKILSQTERERWKRLRLLDSYRSNRWELKKQNEKIRELQRTVDSQDVLLKEASYNLSRIHSEMEDELETAKRIQEGLIPHDFPELINVKSAAVYIPTGKVGGDLYDIIITPHQKIGVLIFDVSGHGIPAAMIGAMAKMLFMHYIEKTDSPAEVFREVNKQLCRFIKTEQYLTAFLGIIDPVVNSMVYSRAGHVPPIVYNSVNGSITKLDSKGFFIGHSALLNLAEYWDQTVQLSPGDKILFYTDGLTEGCSTDGKLYGSERLKEIFLKNGNMDLQQLLDFIVMDQTQFRSGAPLRDDFTLLITEVGNSDFLLADSGFTREDGPHILLVYGFNDIERVCSVILREMDKNGFADKKIKQFKICIFEMLTNAIMHGNNGDTSKRVTVFYSVNTFSSTISVIDEGEGFDYNNLPDPLSPENIMKDHGRGVFLIRNYLDYVEYNQRGNRVLGRKLINGR